MTGEHGDPFRRAKRLRVELGVLTGMLTPYDSPNVWWRCTEGLPKDARVVGMREEYGCLILYLESDEWEPVDNGHEPPDVYVGFLRMDLP